MTRTTRPTKQPLRNLDDFDDLDEALRTVFDSIADARQHITDDECWPGMMLPALRVIEEHTDQAYTESAVTRVFVADLLASAERVTVQRDHALRLIRDSEPLLYGLPEAEATMLTWLATALNVDQGEKRAYWLSRVLALMAYAKQTLDPG